MGKEKQACQRCGSFILTCCLFFLTQINQHKPEQNSYKLKRLCKMHMKSPSVLPRTCPV